MARKSNECWTKAALISLCVVFSMTALSGCTTLRRKFVRQRKTEPVEKYVPVLQPEEYAVTTMVPLEEYKTQYSLLGGYYSDLWDALKPQGNVKRQRYLVSQIAAKIEAMAALLKEARKTQLITLKESALALLAEFDKPEPLRRYDLTVRSFRSIEAQIRKSFRPDMVKDDLSL